ncbi:MAG: aldo/keto reductase [Alphaproteobacteria bacterium]
MAGSGALEKSRLGSTNLNVSKICFGTSGLGDMPNTYGYSVDLERAHRTVEAVFDSRVNFMDTARNYASSEQRIGDVIRARGGLPDGFVLSSKLDRNMETNHFDASQARRSLEESLKTLALDRIPLLHLHDPEHAVSLDEVTGALTELFKMKEEGLCDAVGLAAGTVDVMMPILKDWDFDALITHNRFTLVNRNAGPMLDYAHAKGISVLNAAPYAAGVLAKGTGSYKRYVYQEATDEMLAPVRQVEAICAKYDIPPGAAALQFSMRDPRITSTICGVSKPERVQQTIEWAEFPIPDEAWTELMTVPFSTDDPEASRVYKPG